MTVSPQVMLLGMLLPALVAGLSFWLLKKFLPTDMANRWAPSVCLIGGFLPGYFLSDVGYWPPTSHWQWLPVAILPAVIFGPLSREFGFGHVIRSFIFIPSACIAVWLLVPTWDSLEPSRLVHMLAWGGFLWLVMALLEPLTDKITAPTLAAVFIGTLLGGAIVVVQGGSTLFAKVLLIAMFGMGGLFLVVLMIARKDHLHGIACLFTLLLGGTILNGQVNTFTNVPLASYLLILLAPLTMWISRFGPLAHWGESAKTAVTIALPAITCLLAIFLAEWFAPNLLRQESFTRE